MSDDLNDELKPLVIKRKIKAKHAPHGGIEPLGIIHIYICNPFITVVGS